MWPFTNETPYRRGSEEYYNARSCDPVGQRQRCKYGKIWPAEARPCGPEMTCAHKYYNASIWPYQYIADDRIAVQMTSQAQIANGWAAETTFYDYHFDQYTNELNSSGLGKLVWILNAAPPQYRRAFVAPAQLAGPEEIRMTEIQKEARRLSSEPLEVDLRHSLSNGRPAQEVEAIFDALRKDPLPPKIDYQSVGSAKGG